MRYVYAGIAFKKTSIYFWCCGPFNTYFNTHSKIKRNRCLNYVYKNELDKACFAHDEAYSDNNNLANRTISEKILKGRVYDIGINSK